jgi:hypothetical protein
MNIGESKNITVDEYENIEYGDDYRVVFDQIVDHSGWHIQYRTIYQRGEEYYEVTYRIGATEMQDEGPENIVLKRVEKKEKTIYIYE